MSGIRLPIPNAPTVPSALARSLLSVSPATRGDTVRVVIAGCSAISTATDAETPKTVAIREAFADHWKCCFGQLPPFDELAALLLPPLPIKTVLQFSQLEYARDIEEIEQALADLVNQLHERICRNASSSQLTLFGQPMPKSPDVTCRPLPVGESVTSLEALVDQNREFPTIYADPPWPYENRASRAAAVNHYPTMPIDAICAEPVRDLAADNSHLHLWTTNAFLRESFQVLDAWGFRFKSCLVWVKDKIGMGNYWRVSHEFLLLGVRGNLTFNDRTLPSWIQANRTIHSRKPGVIRALIERASPGPYLELYGREELPDSAWTVYGNDIERRLF